MIHRSGTEWEPPEVVEMMRRCRMIDRLMRPSPSVGINLSSEVVNTKLKISVDAKFNAAYDSTTD